MVDTPTDAGITGAQTTMDSFAGSSGGFLSNIENLIVKMPELGKVILNSLGGDASNSFQEFHKITNGLKDGFSKLIDHAKSFGDNLSDVGMTGSNSIGSVSKSVDKLLVDFSKMGAVMKWDKMFEGTDKGGAAINVLSGDISGLTKILGDLGMERTAKIIEGMGSAFITNAGQAEVLENSYISLMSASGSMNDLFEGSEGRLVDLAAKTKNYTNQLGAIASATGLGIPVTMQFSNALKQLPGYLDQTISSGDGANRSTNVLLNTMKLMTGTGQSETVVTKALADAYDNLGNSVGRVTDQAQKGAEFLADISSVANTLGLQFKDVDQVMSGIAERFKFVGDNSDGAAKVLARYTDALRETGLTGKASMDIVDGMVKSISEMTVGAKAFLSLRSGGPGGLQGSFQIDQLLRQGKLDQVAQMAERSLRQQFGGRIYTQQEAASSPEAAAQFMRQRSLLKSGAFGIGAGASDDQATKLLEALGKRDFGAVTKELKTGQNAVNEVATRGEKIQERNNTELKQIAIQTQRMAIAAEITAGLTMKQLFGTTGGNKAAITETMKKNEAFGEIYTKGEKTATNKEAYQKEEVLSARQMMSQMIDAVVGTSNGAKEGFKELASGVVDTIHDFKGALGMVSETPEQKVMDNTITPPARRTLRQPDRPSQNVLKVATETITGAYTGPATTQARMPTLAEASSSPELATQRARMQKEMEDKHNILKTALHTGINQQRPAAVTTTNKEALKTQVEMKQHPPQKVVLEITAPPGFGVHTKSVPSSIEIINGTVAGAYPGRIQ
jgi:hypothetical protein